MKKAILSLFLFLLSTFLFAETIGLEPRAFSYALKKPIVNPHTIRITTPDSTAQSMSVLSGDYVFSQVTQTYECAYSVAFIVKQESARNYDLKFKVSPFRNIIDSSKILTAQMLIRDQNDNQYGEGTTITTSDVYVNIPNYETAPIYAGEAQYYFFRVYYRFILDSNYKPGEYQSTITVEVSDA